MYAHTQPAASKGGGWCRTSKIIDSPRCRREEVSARFKGNFVAKLAVRLPWVSSSRSKPLVSSIVGVLVILNLELCKFMRERRPFALQ